MKIKQGLVKRIHVQQKNIRANHKDKLNRPVFSIITSKGVVHSSHLKINGPSELIYNEINPLKCGARAWIYTTSEVEVK